MILFVVLTAKNNFAQQDPQYSQYMFNQLVINPAYAGSKEALCMAVSTRNQWVDMPGAPKTNTMFLHGPLLNKSIGLGGYVIQESIGPKKWTGIYGDFAYRFKLGKGKLSLGLSAGYTHYVFDLSKLDFKDASETFSSNTVSPGAMDFTTGFYYNSKSFYIGGSITHLNKAKLDLGSSTTNYSLHKHSFLYLGKGWQINDNLVFNPSLMFKSDDPKRGAQCDLNFNFLLKKRLWLGLSVRQAYGLVFLTQYLVTDKFKIGYSYDRGLNKIGIYGKASHEILISYDFNIFKSKMLSPRYM
jgi:type IX secretion system PorP/SprF family membrane protein